MNVLLLLLLVISSAMPQDAARQANRDYEEGNFTEAELGYRQALERDPDNARLLYNLGNTLARQGKLDEAVQVFEQFKDVETDPAERAKADYNLGNMFSDQEQWDNALERFRESIRANPEDEDARFNYELAYRNDQEEQNQSEEDQQDQDDQQDEENEEEDEQSGENEQQDGDDQEGDQQQPSDGNQDQQSDQQNQPQQPEEGSMTPEQADDILKALDNIEKDLLKDYHRSLINPSGSQEKNW